MAKIKLYSFVLISVCIILCTKSVQAQFYDDGPMFFGGFILGTNFAQVDGDNFAGYRKMGLNGGAVIHSKLDDEFTISMELLYSKKGSKAGKLQLPRFAKDQSTVMTSYSIDMNVAEVPLCINYFMKDKTHFGAGIAYGQLVNAKEFFNGVEQQSLYPFKKSDLSFLFTANFHVYKKFFIVSRMQYSMLNIRKTHNALTGRPEQYNNIFSIKAMYLFK